MAKLNKYWGFVAVGAVAAAAAGAVAALAFKKKPLEDFEDDFDDDFDDDFEEEEEPKKEEKKEDAEDEWSEITIDDFCKVQLKVGEVIESKEVSKSKKLLRNVVKFGEEERVIFSGIKDTYAPGELVGKRVVVAYNLKPRKMMGEMSYGMILVAEDENGQLALASVDKTAFADGSELS